MSTEYQWKIIGMSVYPNSEGQTDVVYNVTWKCEGSRDHMTAKAVGDVSVTFQEGSPFTPYSDLTEGQVWAWVNPTINRTEVEAGIDAKITAALSPTKVTPQLPWTS